jgi:hypothetical protein
MEDFTPPTQPSGALVPPPKGPGTAIAVSVPEPPNRHPRHARSVHDPNPIRRFIKRTLDVVDGMADAVAGGLGLRHP